MGEQYDDDRPTHRRVRIGYAVKDGKLDRDRIGRHEQLPVAEAKRLVANGHARYVTDEQVEAERVKAAEAAQVAGKLPDEGKVTPAMAAQHPGVEGAAADPRVKLWGGAGDDPKPRRAAKPAPAGTSTDSAEKE